MTVRIKADEKIGRLAAEPYFTVYLERSASLDKGLSEVQGRGIDAVRIEVGFRDPKSYTMAPRHLNDLIDLLSLTRDRIADIDPITATEDAS